MPDNKRKRRAKKPATVIALVALALGAIVTTATAPTAAAHETDQYTLPPRRQFAEMGPYLTRMMYDALAKGVAAQNARIKSAVQSHAKAADIEKLQSPEEIANTVNSQFSAALFVIENLDRIMTSSQMATRYPACITGYKPFVGVRKNVDIAISPLRAWNCATIRAFGVWMGDDKIGHFLDMGKHYFDTYREALRKGSSEEKAVRAAIAMGTDGPIYSEKGLLGWSTCGDYSNADLVSNYMGFCFYRNLTSPVMLKGVQRPPLLVRDGPYFRLAPHVRADSDFFSWYVSDHWNEALNPGFYIASLRNGIRKAIVEFRKDNLPRYADANGNPRSPEWFNAKLEQLKTYYGFDYGHLGGEKELIRLSVAGFAPPPDVRKPNVANGDGLLPMHYAAMKGDVLTLQKLQEAGADINAKANASDSVAAIRGDTPLHLAAREGKVPAVAFLLFRGADVRAKNERGVTPLHMAADQPQVALQLIEAGADVAAVDQIGRTPLHWAANDPDGVSTQVLLNHGAKTSAVDREKRTPLHLAAAAGHVDGVETLLHSGAAEIDAADAFGDTPLHLAAANSPIVSSGQFATAVKIVDQLLAAGASVNAKDDFGNSPLLAAVRAGEDEVVATLLAHGADPGAGDAYGQTAAVVARRENEQSILALLKQHAGAEQRAEMSNESNNNSDTSERMSGGH
jgi:ankyrin repeat protein